MVYVGGSRNTLYAIDAATGEHIWEAIGDNYDGIISSPVVVDGVVYVGSDADGTMYALDAATGKEKWSVSIGWVNSSPAVVDGVIYLAFGSRLTAFGNPTPEMRTATAQAQATAEARAFATSEAIQLSWQNYFWTDIYDAFSTGVAEFPGMSVDRTSNIRIAESYVPGGYTQIAYYPVPIEGGPASAMVLLAIFPSKDDADTAMENITGGLIRSGWETQDIKALDHNHICLTVEYSSMSEALCYVTRDDALIISYSAITLPKPESVLLNAVDLVKTVDRAYDEVHRPD